MGIAIWFEDTDEGARWLATEEGEAWMESVDGQEWLQTEAGRGFPFTPAGEHYLGSEWGRKFLRSSAGKTWLRTPPGSRFDKTLRPWAGSFERVQRAAGACLIAMLLAGGLGMLANDKSVDAWLLRQGQPAAGSSTTDPPA